jgi:predicted negative regulator of RcsB-dependent stress response
MSQFWRWFGVGLFTLVVLAAIIVGGWQAGWWFSNANATREAHQIRNGYSNQQTLREQITTQIANVDTLTSQIAASHDSSLIAALKAQRASVAGIACQDASEVTGDPLPAQQAQWATRNCAAGVVRPASPYYQAGTP